MVVATSTSKSLEKRKGEKGPAAEVNENPIILPLGRSGLHAFHDGKQHR